MDIDRFLARRGKSLKGPIKLAPKPAAAAPAVPAPKVAQSRSSAMSGAADDLPPFSRRRP